MRNRILLIDDTVTLAESIADSLRMEGFIVSVCYSGDQAFNLLGQIRVDLIITDLKMVGLDGVEITKMIRGSAELKSLPVIILTADTNKANELEVYEAGADLLLHKPFDEEYFLKCITEILSNNDNQD
jgi:DNA-binding response OmpR family regulator